MDQRFNDIKLEIEGYLAEQNTTTKEKQQKIFDCLFDAIDQKMTVSDFRILSTLATPAFEGESLYTYLNLRGHSLRYQAVAVRNREVQLYITRERMIIIKAQDIPLEQKKTQIFDCLFNAIANKISALSFAGLLNIAAPVFEPESLLYTHRDPDTNKTLLDKAVEVRDTCIMIDLIFYSADSVIKELNRYLEELKDQDDTSQIVECIYQQIKYKTKRIKEKERKAQSDQIKANIAGGIPGLTIIALGATALSYPLSLAYSSPGVLDHAMEQFLLTDMGTSIFAISIGVCTIVLAIAVFTAIKRETDHYLNPPDKVANNTKAEIKKGIENKEISLEQKRTQIFDDFIKVIDPEMALKKFHTLFIEPNIAGVITGLTIIALAATALSYPLYLAYSSPGVLEPAMEHFLLTDMGTDIFALSIGVGAIVLTIAVFIAIKKATAHYLNRPKMDTNLHDQSFNGIKAEMETGIADKDIEVEQKQKLHRALDEMRHKIALKEFSILFNKTKAEMKKCIEDQDITIEEKQTQIFNYFFDAINHEMTGPQFDDLISLAKLVFEQKSLLYIHHSTSGKTLLDKAIEVESKAVVVEICHYYMTVNEVRDRLKQLKCENNTSPIIAQMSWTLKYRFSEFPRDNKPTIAGVITGLTIIALGATALSCPLSLAYNSPGVLDHAMEQFLLTDMGTGIFVPIIVVGTIILAIATSIATRTATAEYLKNKLWIEFC